jgi:hypothetical protein
MKNLIWMIFFCLGCSQGLRVYSDYDREFNLNEFKTYQWASQKEIEVRNNPLYFNELTDKRIKAIADGQLTIKGLTLAENEPDVIIHYHIVVDDKFSVASDPYGIYGPYWMGSRGNVVQYKEGTLIIDIMDRKTSSLIWRGYAVSVIEDDNEEITEEMLIKAIVKIFEQFRNAPV